MKSVSGKTLARAVERKGWKLLRVNGSHHIFGKAGSIVRLSIRFMAIVLWGSACFGIFFRWLA